jgi:hypothetical protein
MRAFIRWILITIIICVFIAGNSFAQINFTSQFVLGGDSADGVTTSFFGMSNHIVFNPIKKSVLLLIVQLAVIK